MSSLEFHSVINFISNMLFCASFLVIGLVYGKYTATQLNDVFAAYKERFGYNFGLDEAYRKKVFHDNLLYINESNSKGLPYTLSITPFTHLTNDEFREIMTMKFPRDKPTFRYSGHAGEELKESIADLPKSVDYVKKGLVTRVKDQGFCGSCWAFSTTGALEGAYMKATGKLISLSEQQLVDCSSSYERLSALEGAYMKATGKLISLSEQQLVDCSSRCDNYGCGGGDQFPTFQYVAASGLESERDYPYTAVDGDCTYNSSKSIIKNGTVVAHRVQANSSAALLKALVEQGPISISLDGGSDTFQSYKGGVIDRSCGTEINHAVLLVGYDMTAPRPYYLVKNSWGAEWGEEGYVKIAIDESKEGVCGILSDSSYPSLKI